MSELILGSPVRAWPVATNAIELRASPGWSGTAMRAESWRISRWPEELDNEFHPSPARVVATEEGVILYLDGDMVPGAPYRIFPPRLSNNAITVEPDIAGPLRTVRAIVDPADRPLSDWNMPGNGDRLTGDIAAQGNDYATVTGQQAIVNAVWANILTPQGRIDWDPTFGTQLGLKQVRAVDLAAEQRRLAGRLKNIPGVRAAAVQVSFANDHARISVELQLMNGTTVLEREVGNGSQ